MSTNNAKISRVLVVNSPVHLWTILKNKEDLFHSEQSLNLFMYTVNRYINGCRCDDDIHLPSMNKEYESLSKNVIIIELLKVNIQCTDIIFNNNLK